MRLAYLQAGAALIHTIPTLEHEPSIGQVWRWYVENWDELWLLLANPHLNDGAWDALNLDTGKVETVMPYLSAGQWELVQSDVDVARVLQSSHDTP